MSKETTGQGGRMTRKREKNTGRRFPTQRYETPDKVEKK
jgi:hypothetical protein